MKVTGVFRLGDNKRALGVSFAGEPTDDELRAFHDSISARSPVVEVTKNDIRIVKPATPIDQSALIRELVGALTKMCESAELSWSRQVPISGKSPSLQAARNLLVNVPDEFKE